MELKQQIQRPGPLLRQRQMMGTIPMTQPQTKQVTGCSYLSSTDSVTGLADFSNVLTVGKLIPARSTTTSFHSVPLMSSLTIVHSGLCSYSSPRPPVLVVPGDLVSREGRSYHDASVSGRDSACSSLGRRTDSCLSDQDSGIDEPRSLSAKSSFDLPSGLERSLHVVTDPCEQQDESGESSRKLVEVERLDDGKESLNLDSDLESVELDVTGDNNLEASLSSSRPMSGVGMDNIDPGSDADAIQVATEGKHVNQSEGTLDNDIADSWDTPKNLFNPCLLIHSNSQTISCGAKNRISEENVAFDFQNYKLIKGTNDGLGLPRSQKMWSQTQAPDTSKVLGSDKSQSLVVNLDGSWKHTTATSSECLAPLQRSSCFDVSTVSCPHEVANGLHPGNDPFMNSRLLQTVAGNCRSFASLGRPYIVPGGYPSVSCRTIQNSIADHCYQRNSCNLRLTNCSDACYRADRSFWTEEESKEYIIPQTSRGLPTFHSSYHPMTISQRPYSPLTPQSYTPSQMQPRRFEVHGHESMVTRNFDGGVNRSLDTRGRHSVQPGFQTVALYPSVPMDDSLQSPLTGVSMETRRSTKHLGSEVVAVLMEWFDQNRSHPYPDPSTKQLLAEKAGIKPAQVSGWFSRKRRSMWTDRFRSQHNTHNVASENKDGDAEQQICAPPSNDFIQPSAENTVLARKLVKLES